MGVATKLVCFWVYDEKGDTITAVASTIASIKNRIILLFVSYTNVLIFWNYQILIYFYKSSYL
jgi:hypothetical protein